MAININGTSGISGVDGSAGTPALQGSDTNTGISFGTDTVNINTGGTTRATVDSSGRVLVGTSTARANFFNSASGQETTVQIEGTTGGTSSFSLTRNTNGEDPPHLIFGKTRGTSVGSNTVVQSGDRIGLLDFQGADGSELVRAASIETYVDGTPGANDMPGRLVFSVTRDSQSSPTESARINNAGFFKASSTGGYNNATGGYHELRSGANASQTFLVTHTNSDPYGVEINYTAASPNGTTNWFLNCSDTNGNRATIRSNGGLANYQANNVNLSDINTKKNISPAANTWDCIKEWEIVNYRYKDQPDDADLNLGVIAQQVAESCPEVITVFEEAKDDQPEKLGIKEQQMYWMAIKALQEAQVRIEALEAEVAALKAR